MSGATEPHPVLTITTKRSPLKLHCLDRARAQDAISSAGDIEPRRHDFGDPDRPKRPSEESWAASALTWILAFALFAACFVAAGFLMGLGWTGARLLIAWICGLPADVG
jgi:hypothetical protein